MIAGLKQIGTGRARQFDIHAFKDSVVPGNGAKYNVSVETTDGSVWLTPVKAGSLENVETFFNSLRDVMEEFPIRE